MPKRIKTNYPGVYYRETKRIGGKGSEKVYYIVFKKDGKTIEEKAGRQHADDMTPARAAGIRADRIEGKRLSRKEIRQQKEQKKAYTIGQLWESYKDSRPENKSLITDVGRYKNYIKPHFGTKEPQELLLTDIDKLNNTLKKKLAPQTVKHILNLLGWIVNFGVKRNLCAGIPFHIEKPEVHNEKTEDLTPDELEKLLDAIEKDENIHAKNMMKLTLFTGVRRGEMFKLKWEDINYNRGFISLVDPKGGPDQKIPLNDAAREILSDHPKTDSPYVFPGKDGKKRVTIRKPVNRIKKNAGLPKDFRPLHGLRHTYASMLASSGKVDLYTLQKLLTHKDPRMTQRYAHLRDEALKKASNLAGEMVTGLATNKGESSKQEKNRTAE
jgi:integrase